MLDTCKYSATGGNAQDVSWMVFSKNEDIQKISQLTIDFMRSIQGTTHFLLIMQSLLLRLMIMEYLIVGMHHTLFLH